jgi:hypothetical protein
MLPPAAGTESTVIGGTHEHIQQWGRIAPAGAEKGAAQHALAHPARLRLSPAAPDPDAQRTGHRPGGSATSDSRADPGHLRDPDLTTRITEEDAQWPVGSLRVFTPTIETGQELDRAGSTDHTTSDGDNGPQTFGCRFDYRTETNNMRTPDRVPIFGHRQCLIGARLPWAGTTVFALRNQPSSGARRTLPPICTVSELEGLVCKSARIWVIGACPVSPRVAWWTGHRSL